MSRRKSWSRRKRVSFAVLAAIILATSAWAAISRTGTFALSTAATLDAPIPAPQDVFIQKRNNSDGVGNAFVLVQLSPEQVSAKLKDGTADFLTIGNEESMVILRDDGVGGDRTAKDGLYTGIIEVDMRELRSRADQDRALLAKHPNRLIPHFAGRVATTAVRPVAFDFTNFENGAMVRLTSRVRFLQPEGAAPPPITHTDPVTPLTNDFQDRALMITDTDVIADPTRTWNPCNNTGTSNGVWTFNRLMRGIANTNDPEVFVESWLNHWLTTYTVHPTISNDSVPARVRMQEILDEWPRVGGQLDLEQSPLRLLAIVPRVDLRGGGGGYGGGNFNDGGELRFIFGFVAKAVGGFDPTIFTGEAQINNSNCYALPFTVIFEYKVPREGCEEVRDWAQRWVNLSFLIPGNTSSYNADLASLTEEVVQANASPGSPNGSALSQLRTNEVALADTALGEPWELREFRLDDSLGSPFASLEPSAVADTIQNDPGHDYNQNANATGLLASWIQDVVKPLISSNFEASLQSKPVPPTYQLPDPSSPPNPNPNPIEPFLAADARIIEPDPRYITFHWGDLTNLNVDPSLNLAENWARHRVSRATCNGCHMRETFTHFTHVNPSNTTINSVWSGSNWSPIDSQGNPSTDLPSLPAELSPFLTGINQLGDPANADFNGLDVRSPFEGNPKRNFDDLARREQDINNVATMTCFGMPRANHDLVLRSRETTGRLPANLFEGVSPGERRSVSVDDLMRNVITEVH